MSFQGYYHSYLIHVSSTVKTKFLCPALQETIIRTAVCYGVTFFPFYLLAPVSANELSQNPAFATFMTNSLTKHKQLSN
jgi:hypothetical protein